MQQECLPFDGLSDDADGVDDSEDSSIDEMFRYDSSDDDDEVFGFDEDFDFDV